MTAQKRKKSSDEKNTLKKRKKSKIEEKDKVPRAEFLDIKTLREGMLLLGCIIEIRSNCLLLSLPGCLVGTVPIKNISNEYTQYLKASYENENSEEISLENLFHLGATIPCKVLKFSLHEDKKPTIILSIDPKVVNSNLRISSLYQDMVLYVAVASIEDHGYVLDTGIKNTRGFIPFNQSDSSKLFSVGQVIPTQLKAVPKSKHEECVLTLAALSFNDTFPEVTEIENVKLSALIPGVRVSAFVSEVTQHFLYLKCLNYDACCSLLSTSKKYKKAKEGTTISGTVLYIHPVTNLVFLHLGSLPTPESYNNFFDLHKFDRIKNLKFQASCNHKLFFKYQNSMAYVKMGDVAGKTTLSHESLLKNPIVPKARVVFLHHMDNLIQVTFKESMLKMKVVKLEDVQVGDIYETTVKKHVENGMFVSICPGVSGFVRHLHFSDSYITMPEKLYPVDKRVKCRVLSIHPTSGLNLTCKESLINLSDNVLLKSYAEAIKGYCYKGVIVKKTDNFIIVLFFNNVQGIVSQEGIPETSVFYVGQTVLCSVINCNVKREKLSLSLDTEKHRSENDIPINTRKVLTETEENENFSSESEDEEKDSSKPEDKKSKLLKDETDSASKDVLKPVFKEGKKYKAIIKKVTAHQLNIIMEGGKKARVHVTQVGCSEEGVLPMTQFTVGQTLKVYAIKEHERRSHNFLVISHQRMKSYLECSLTYPTSSPVLNEDIKIDEPILGFVKKVYDDFALIWISPSVSGKLEFVNIPEPAKALRKLRKTLKLGQSLNVSILNSIESPENKDKLVKLTTPEISVPDIGKNVAGFVMAATIEKGLILKLSHNYTGSVCLTDIQDVYTPLQPMLTKLLKLKFILCNVLEVDHEKKSCILSLRQTRLYGKELNRNKDICPEITLETVNQGQTVKGYVKSMSDSHIKVIIGRNLSGKISLKKCTKYDCVCCLKIADLVKTLAVGQPIDVMIDDIVPVKDLITLSLSGSLNMSCTENTGLKVKEDINWDDLS